jgi:hypothetical protein
VVLGAGAAALVAHFDHRRGVSPLRARIVAIAGGQVGYRTHPSDTYMGQFVTTIWRGEAAVRCAAGAVSDTTDSTTAAPDLSPGTATAGERSGVGPASARLTSDPFSARPVCP